MDQDTAPEHRAGWRRWHAGATLRLGVSSCLLGEEVRYDGGHKRDRFLVDVLGSYVEWVPVCPEVEVGMPVPRPTIRLVDSDSGVRLCDPASGADHTAAMQAYSERRIATLGVEELDGYVLKRASPSCGMERVSVWAAGGTGKRKEGVGLYARALMERYPLLPVEEEGRLNDAPLRENFIERAFCRNRWRALVRSGLNRGRLVEFHTAHKLLLRAHDEAGYGRLGRLVGQAGMIDDELLYERYEHEFQATLRHKASVPRHVNVLQHALGYFKHDLEAREKREVLASIEDYRQRILPLIVPLTVLRFLTAKYEVEYLRGQLYFDPHPRELMLRNHC